MTPADGEITESKPGTSSPEVHDEENPNDSNKTIVSSDVQEKRGSFCMSIFKCLTLKNLLIFLLCVCLSPVAYACITVVTVSILPLLMAAYVVVRLIQFFIKSENFDQHLEFVILLRIWIVCAVMLLLVEVGIFYPVAKYVPELQLVQVIGLPITMWIKIICILIGIYLLSQVAWLCLSLPILLMMDDENKSTFVIEAVAEIVTCLFLHWAEVVVMNRVSTFKESKIFGVYTEKWIRASIYVLIGHNIITLLTHLVVWSLPKYYGDELEEGKSSTISLGLLKSAFNRRYVVYIACGIKRSIIFLLTAIMILFTWLLHMGDYLETTPEEQKVFQFGTKTLICVLICSFLWLIKSCILLNFEAQAVYDRLHTKMADIGKQFYFLVLLSKDHYKHAFPEKPKDAPREDSPGSDSDNTSHDKKGRWFLKQSNSEGDAIYVPLERKIVRKELMKIVKQEPEPEPELKSYIGIKQELRLKNNIGVKREPEAKSNIGIKQEPEAKNNIGVKQEPEAKNNDIDNTKQEPEAKNNIGVKQEPEAKNNDIDNTKQESGSKKNNGRKASIYDIQQVAQRFLSAQFMLSEDSMPTNLDHLQKDKFKEDNEFLIKRLKKIIEHEDFQDDWGTFLELLPPDEPTKKDEQQQEEEEQQHSTSPKTIQAGDITIGKVKTLMERAHNRCKFITNTINSEKDVVRCLNQIISGLILITTFIAWLLLTGLAKTNVLVLIASPLLAATFIFGDTCKSLFQGLIFVYVVHPFDVGDLCEIDDNLLEVKRIGVWSTVFSNVRSVGKQHEAMYPNSELTLKKVINHKTDFNWNDSIEFSLSFLDKVKTKKLKQDIENFLNEESLRFTPSFHSVEFKEIEDTAKIVVHVQHIVRTGGMTCFECLKEKEKRRFEFALDIQSFVNQYEPKKESEREGDQNSTNDG